MVIYLHLKIYTEALINQKLHSVYSKYCPNFKGFNGGTKPHDDRIKYFFDNNYEYITFDKNLHDTYFSI